MSTIVCQNMVSCFEPQLTETTTTTLKLKVAAPPPPPASEPKKTNPQFGPNWGFLQTTPKDDNCYTTYTHPSSQTTSSSFSRLSPQSLQLCTENLGSETGTDILTDGCTIFSPPPNSDQIPLCRNRAAKSDDCNHERTKKSPNSCREIKNFPPPLTSMSGGGASSLRHHREGGRLIIEAVEAPFRNSYLQAERCDGRLRLCFFTAAVAGGEQEHDDDDDEEEEQEQGDECGEEMTEETEEDETEETEEEPVSEIESENEESDEGISLEMEKFQWMRRCNESGHGNKGLCSSWKPALWVATS